MRRNVLLAPAPILSRPTRPVERIDSEVLAVCRDLLDTMRGTDHSVGVAAPQIGVDLRIFCVDVSGHTRTRVCHGELVLINPVVVEAHGSGTAREGCMSVPDLTGDVRRPDEIRVQGRTPEGDRVEIATDAFEARAVQHELDHLDGFLFVDRVASARHLHARRVYR